MRQDRMRESTNIEDRRGMGVRRGPGLAAGGGVGMLILVVIVILLGGNPLALLQSLPQTGPGGQTPSGPVTIGVPTAEQEKAASFVARVLGDTEDVWTELFRQMGLEYVPPTLVLFSGAVESGCGYASAQTGPFYCPADSRVYIDLEFFTDLSERFGAPGDFAQAYVIAHEVGHHVQNLLGDSDRVHAMRDRLSEAEYNQLSVRLELQADFYAGVWAHHAQSTREILESGDVEEGLRAAAAIGDDHLQRQARGFAVPESFTHGSSDQRVHWFRKGLETGDIRQGDTFSVPRP